MRSWQYAHITTRANTVTFDLARYQDPHFPYFEIIKVHDESLRHVTFLRGRLEKRVHLGMLSIENKGGRPLLRIPKNTVLVETYVDNELHCFKLNANKEEIEYLPLELPNEEFLEEVHRLYKFKPTRLEDLMIEIRDMKRKR